MRFIFLANSSFDLTENEITLEVVRGVYRLSGPWSCCIIRCKLLFPLSLSVQFHSSFFFYKKLLKALFQVKKVCKIRQQWEKTATTPTLTTGYDEPAVRWHRDNPQNGANYQADCAPEQKSSLEVVFLQLDFPLGFVDGGCVWHLEALFARIFILLFGKVGSRLFFFLFYDLRNFTNSV